MSDVADHERDRSAKELGFKPISAYYETDADQRSPKPSSQ